MREPNDHVLEALREEYLSAIARCVAMGYADGAALYARLLTRMMQRSQCSVCGFTLSVSEMALRVTAHFPCVFKAAGF